MGLMLNKNHPCVKTFRKAKADTIKATRERIAFAKLLRYSRHPKAMIFGVNALRVAFASEAFKASEIAWLEERQ